MALTPNKNYNNQVTGSNVNTWGVVNNANFSTIDSNLGGRVAVNVAGSSNITVTANQAQSLIHVLSGLLTGSIQYIFPALGGLYLVENASTGSFNITIMCAGGSVGAIIPQGMRGIVFVNPDDTSVKVDLIGSQLSVGLAASTGSANVQAVATMIPGPYILEDGAVSVWTAGFTCSGSMTLALGGTAIKTSKKLSSSGYVNLASGDVTLNQKYLSFYDKTSDVHVILNPTITLGTLASMGIGAGLVNDGSGNLTIATSAALPGSPTTTTQAATDSSTKVATTAFAKTMDSPAFVGIPTVPTAAVATNTIQAASTAFARTNRLLYASSNFSTYDTTTTIIPQDNTVPQITEGKEFMNISYTPVYSTSTLIIEATGFVYTFPVWLGIGAIFQDAIASALSASTISPGDSNDSGANLYMRLVVSAVNTVARTYRFRAGPSNSSGTFGWLGNPNAGGALFGAARLGIMSVTEIPA